MLCDHLLDEGSSTNESFGVLLRSLPPFITPFLHEETEVHGGSANVRKLGSQGDETQT